MLIDYHLHTFLSDGIQKHEKYIKKAIKKKITEIGFSEHLNFKGKDWVMKISDLATCVKIVEGLKKEAKIPLKLGIEIDYLPEGNKKIREIIENNPFDYIIGAVHFIGDWCFDCNEEISGYQNWDIDELYKAYFDLVQKAAKSRLFDIIAHPDIIKKFGFRPNGDISNLLKETAECFKENKVCIEVNTSGLDKPCKEIYPSKEFLKMCFNKGIPIIFGSDAHKPEEVGRYFEKAIKLVKGVGYTKITQFTKRKRKFVKI